MVKTSPAITLVDATDTVDEAYAGTAPTTRATVPNTSEQAEAANQRRDRQVKLEEVTSVPLHSNKADN
jgi:hypothetical protein